MGLCALHRRAARRRRYFTCSHLYFERLTADRFDCDRNRYGNGHGHRRRHPARIKRLGKHISLFDGKRFGNGQFSDGARAIFARFESAPFRPVFCQDFQSVPFSNRFGQCDLYRISRRGDDLSDVYADVVLHLGIHDRASVREVVALGKVAAVERALKFVDVLARDSLAAQRGAVFRDGGIDIVRLFEPALYFEAVHPSGFQFFKTRYQALIGRRKQVARLAERTLITHATRLQTSAAIAAVAAAHRRHQTRAAERNAQRAMHEIFDLERGVLFDLAHIFEQGLSRDNDARKAVSFEISRTLEIVYAHLRARVQRYVEMRQSPRNSDVGDDKRVRSRSSRGVRKPDERALLPGFNHGVESDVAFYAVQMTIVNQVFDIALVKALRFCARI